MAHVVGVPKREPCQKCHMPVFLAERLSLGKLMFHRTCLKCARCNSQLSPGSFYETEEDGVFCCETCPDEEKESPILIDDLRGPPPPPPSSSSNSDRRKSFAEKLAIFQNDNDKALLRKSLSDEEKSRSLKRLSALYGGSVEYKKNSAFSTFITSQVEEVKHVEQKPLSINAEISESSSDEDNTESEDTPCPVIDDKTIYGSSTKQQINLSITSPSKPQSSPPPPPQPSSPPSSSSQINLSVVNNDHSSELSDCELLPNNIEASCGEIKNNIDSSYNVTKEDDNDQISSAIVITSNNTIVTVADNVDQNNDDKLINDKAEYNKNNENIDNNLNMMIRNSSSNSRTVRSRLNQFEKLFADDVTATTSTSTVVSMSSATTTTTICNLSVSTSDVNLDISNNINNIIENNDNNILVPIDEQNKLQQDVSINCYKNVISCEDLTTIDSICKFNHEHSDSNHESDHEQTSEIKEENNYQSVSIDSGIANSLSNLPKMKVEYDNMISEPIQVPPQIIEKPSIDNAKSDIEDQPPKTVEECNPEIPTPRQRVSKMNSDSSSEKIAPPTPIRRRTITKPEVKPRSPVPIVKYPENLNPFDSDDDATADAIPAESFKCKRDSMNPFDSEDDDIELLKSDTIHRTSKETSKAKYVYE